MSTTQDDQLRAVLGMPKDRDYATRSLPEHHPKHPLLADLDRQLERVRKAPLLQRAAAAEALAISLRNVLVNFDRRLTDLERDRRGAAGATDAGGKDERATAEACRDG